VSNDLPETELTADNLGGDVRDVVITDRAPSRVVEHFQASLTRMLTARQSH